MEAGVEQPNDRPALGHVVELAERAQVAEERFGLIAGVERRIASNSAAMSGVRQSSVMSWSSSLHISVLLRYHADMTMATAFEILPAIDLRGGHVVRLQQGDFGRETMFSDDAAVVAEGFARQGATWLHVVDLDGARSGTRVQASVIAGIVAAVAGRVRIEVAGGLRDEGAVAAALTAGAARVVVGTAAIEDPAFAGRLIAGHGAERIAVAIDVREGRAVGHGWTPTDRGMEVAEAIRRSADQGIATFEVTAIDRDGLLGGPDVPLYERLVQLDRGSIIASGGIATADDVREVRSIGCTGAIVGRALYEGRLALDVILAALEPT